MSKLGFKHSEETKEKIRQATFRNNPGAFKKGNKINLGRVKSNEQREKISLGNASVNASRHKARLLILRRQEIKAGRKKPDKCELCGKVDKICFDHDHKTGKFRGWICRHCNSALGYVKDNIQILELMIEYIKNNK